MKDGKLLILDQNQSVSSRKLSKNPIQFSGMDLLECLKFHNSGKEVKSFSRLS